MDANKKGSREAASQSFTGSEKVRLAFIRVSSRFFGQHQSLPLQPRVLEVQNNAAAKTGDAEVIQHLPALMVRNAPDRLRVNDQLLLHHKIGDIFSHDLTFIHDPMPLLLRVWDASQPELHTKAVLINLLVQTMSSNVQYFDCAADYRIYFLL